MASILRAVAKSLSKIAGPLGFPAEFAISLYDDERAELRQQILIDKLSQGEAITAEILGEIMELKSTQQDMHAQLLTSFQCLLNFLAQQQPLLKEVKKRLENREDENEIVNLLVQTGSRYKDDMERQGLLTEDIITRELTRLFEGQGELFDAIIAGAGYPMGSLKHSSIEKVHFRNAIVGMRGLNRDRQRDIVNALMKEKDGSTVLKNWLSLFVG